MAVRLSEKENRWKAETTLEQFSCGCPVHQCTITSLWPAFRLATQSPVGPRASLDNLDSNSLNVYQRERNNCNENTCKTAHTGDCRTVTLGAAAAHVSQLLRCSAADICTLRRLQNIHNRFMDTILRLCQFMLGWADHGDNASYRIDVALWSHVTGTGNASQKVENPRHTRTGRTLFLLLLQWKYSQAKNTDILEPKIHSNNISKFSSTL